jgi:hypothetical protein
VANRVSIYKLSPIIANKRSIGESGVARLQESQLRSAGDHPENYNFFDQELRYVNTWI